MKSWQVLTIYECFGIWMLILSWQTWFWNEKDLTRKEKIYPDLSYDKLKIQAKSGGIRFLVAGLVFVLGPITSLILGAGLNGWMHIGLGIFLCSCLVTKLYEQRNGLPFF